MIRWRRAARLAAATLSPDDSEDAKPVPSHATFVDQANLSPATLRQGWVLADRYVIERPLGHGGMATVYLAEEPKHERRVAIKVLHPELGRSLGSERFHREIRIVARLSHPYIVPLIDSGEADGQLYYVSPFIPGGSLCAVCTASARCPSATRSAWRARWVVRWSSRTSTASCTGM